MGAGADWGGALALSAALHVAACAWIAAGLAEPPPPREEAAITLLRELPARHLPPADLPPPPAPEPPSAPELPPEPPPEPPVQVAAPERVPAREAPARPRPRRASAAVEPAPAPSEPAPAEEGSEPAGGDGEVADFTHLTLGRAGSGGWNVPLGDGRAGSGWVRADGRRHGGMGTGRGRGMGPGLSRSAPPATPMGRPRPAVDRSRPPVQPSGLQSFIERHYPAAARREGRQGDAWVRVRIERDGRVGRVLERGGTESFARACERALREGPRWTPARSRSGQPRSRVIRFRCRFRVR